MRNKRRIIRLIENNGVRPTKKILRAKTLVMGIRRSPAELAERISQRIEMMLRQGFVDEVKLLAEKYGWDIEPMKAPDYLAIADYIHGNISLEDAKLRCKQNDLHLAKKQRTWFKRNKSIQWTSNRDEVVELVTTFLNKYR